MNQSTMLPITYYSDLLCAWAYVAQRHLDQLKADFGSRITISYHFIPILGNTQDKVAKGWGDQGYDGLNEAVNTMSQNFPHVEIHPDLWKNDPPASSSAPHHFLKAAQLLEQKGIISAEPQRALSGNSLFEEMVWRSRLAFFRKGKNIAHLDCLMAIAEGLKLPVEKIGAEMESGKAMAALFRDSVLNDELKLDGSPTLVLNEGRQKLYGNLSYAVIEANVRALLVD